MADNDNFRILVGGTATNAGFVEIATADDGTEPIYVRQYSGAFATLTRTLTLLDGSGNTSIPGSLTISGDLTVNGTTTTINSTVTTVDDITFELGSVATPTDVTAAGGGIVLKGTTDKTITWGATNGWTSTETLNIATGKTYKINGTDVLSATTLGSGVTGSSLTSVGTITSGTWSGSFGAVSGANLTSLTAGNLSGTIPSTVLGNSTVNIGTTAVALNRASANLALTGISSITGVTSITFAAEASDAASISTTVSTNQTFFDFNLADDNNNDWWRWRFTPSGSTVYDAMTLKPSANGVADLVIAGTITGTRLISNVAQGTSPLSVTSTTLVTNLNADLLDGNDSTYFTNATNLASGTVPAARMPAHTGDATSTAGSVALTLATVNSNVGAFGSASSIPVITVNAKGLVTAVSTATVASIPAQTGNAGKYLTTDGTTASWADITSSIQTAATDAAIVMAIALG
jgi:hypothetical protein